MHTITTDSPEKTMSCGEALGRLCRGGEVIALYGDLGAGKTHFTKGVARGLEVEDPVTSPTFILIREYRRSRLTFHHMDAYRLSGVEEVDELGVDEIFSDPQSVAVVEWPERIEEALPAERLDIYLSHRGETSRELKFSPRGETYCQLVNQLIRIQL